MLAKNRSRVIAGIVGIAIVFAFSFFWMLSSHEDGTHDDKGHEHGEDHGEDGHKGEHDDHGKDSRTLTISEESQQLAGIEVNKARVGNIKATVNLNGRIFPNQNKLAQIVSRNPGVVKQVQKSLGDHVKAGETLARVEANGSLSVFPIISKIDGTIIQKEIVVGEFVSNKEILFVVANLATVWVNLNITERDFDKIKEDQTIFIKLWDHIDTLEAKINYIAPIIHPDSQTQMARAEINNSSGLWRPGSFVTAEVITGEKDTGLVVNEDAIQVVEEKSVIFARVKNDQFEMRQVETGLRGRGFVEIVSGLKVGEDFAAKKSFALKAELLKSQAGHDHGH